MSLKEVVEVKKETVEPRKAEIKPEPPKEVVKLILQSQLKQSQKSQSQKETNVVKMKSLLKKLLKLRKSLPWNKKVREGVKVVKQELAKKIEVENKKRKSFRLTSSMEKLFS